MRYKNLITKIFDLYLFINEIRISKCKIEGKKKVIKGLKSITVKAKRDAQKKLLNITSKTILIYEFL